MMGRTLNRISKLRERRPPPCNCFGCAVKQIAATELATPAQMSTAVEMRPDMNGSSVVNGHASVNGAQAAAQTVTLMATRWTETAAR